MNHRRWTMTDEQRAVHRSGFIVHRHNVGKREVDEDEKNISTDLFDIFISSDLHSYGFWPNRPSCFDRDPESI